MTEITRGDVSPLRWATYADMTDAEIAEYKAAELRANAAASDAARAESFERCDTDGFVTQWALGLSAQKDRMQARIVEDGGLASFLTLFTVDGEWTPCKRIEGRYGPRWLVLDTEGNSTGVFLPYQPRKRSTLAAKGYCEGYGMFPAKADYWAPPGARGLSGATSVRLVAVRTGDWKEPPAEILSVDRFEGAEKMPERPL